MSDSDTVAIVVSLVVLALVLLIVLICCKHNEIGLFRNCHRAIPDVLVCCYTCQPKEKKAVAQAKRCEQDSVRDVENEIIERSPLSERTWRPDIKDPQTPIVVFCVVASRIGADIDAAMREVNDWNRVILIVLHNKHSSQLTGDLSDNDYLLDDGIRSKLEDRIVHFAFSEYERLYDCRQNNEGFRKMRELIANFRYSP